MNGLALAPTHAVRASVLEDELTFRLGPDSLEVQDSAPASPAGIVNYPYRDIVGVRLSFAPNRVDSERYRYDLRMRSGQKLAILSTHYAGFADFENRAATYVPFVRALIARVAKATPSASFHSGKQPVIYWAEHVFLLAMIAFLIFVLAAVGFAPLSESSWTKLLVVLGCVPLLIAYTRKNRPRGFRPDAIPTDVLPTL